jgi:hypothetical protein
MNFAKTAIAAAMLGLAGYASTSYALPSPNGSFGGTEIGSITTVSGGAWQIGTSTTSITVPGFELISAVSDPYLGNPNNLLNPPGTVPGVGSTFTFSSNTFAVANGSVAFDLFLDSYTFHFTNEIVTSKVNGNIGLYFSGNLIADASGNLAVPAAASFSATFTQSAPSGAIAAAYSINTPPAPLVPEIDAIAGTGALTLLGGALVLAGERRRRA